jgi:hypothetical protein
VQALCRAAEVQLLRDGEEGAQVPQLEVHQDPPASPRRR